MLRLTVTFVSIQYNLKAKLELAVIMSEGWDSFSKNLAADFAPILALFGESPTKQYLSECLDLTDILIFSAAPIGIITALVSAIRVRGSPSLRAFIGHAQEGGGIAEAELRSSTSRDVCELYNNGGIARVFGRPKLLEVVLDRRAEGVDFYKGSDGEPAKAGIYSFGEYIHMLKKRHRQQDSQDKKGDRDGTKHGINAIETSKTKNHVKAREEDWEEITDHHTHKNSRDAEANSEVDITFAPNPNLSLNVGIKNRGQGWFLAAAGLGVALQSGVLIWAGVARYTIQGQGFVRKTPTNNYAVPMAVIGTIFLALGVGLCAHLIEKSTEERKFKRKDIPGQSRMYWVQPGIQYVGDQAFDSFAYSDRGRPLTTYISSRKKPHVSTATYPDEPKQSMLVWIAICLTTLGFIAQFLGLRACHSSVAVAQLGVMLVMTIFRAFLRTQRLKQEENCMSDHPDAYVGHELDWLAFYMDLENSTDGTKTHPDVPICELVSSAILTSDNRAQILSSLTSFNCAQISLLKEETVPPECPKPDVIEGMVAGFEGDKESLEWLQEVYNLGSTRAEKSIPHEWSRRFSYRSRLARMTKDWSDNHVASRDVARRLAQAITETANVLTTDATVKEGWTKVKVFVERKIDD